MLALLHLLLLTYSWLFAQVNGLAQMGKYTGEVASRGHPSTTGSLYEKGYQY